MKMHKIFWYDIKNGCLKNLKLLLLPIIFEVIILFLMMQKIYRFEQYNIGVQTNLGDVIMYNFGGMAKYVLSAEKVFEFPVIWMLLFVMILFATLSYPISNLQGFGNKVLVKCHSRMKWWLAKCMWNLMCNVVFFGVLFIIILVFCKINNIPFDMQVNGELQTVLFELDADTTLKTYASMPLIELVLVFMVSVTICQIQMLLGLWIKSVYSFMSVCMLLLISAYFQSNVLIGNYAMIIRHSWINEHGIDCGVGILVMCILILLTVIVGLMRFNKYDIIQEEN